jgi:polyisoprenoid-binding protein YceI
VKTIKTLLLSIPLFYFVSCSSPQTENKVEATDPAATPANEATGTGTVNYSVVNDLSTIKWMGSNKFTPKKHEGTIMLADGSFLVEGAQLVAGSFTADMTTINSTGDEFTDGMAKVGNLIGHLKSPDFFEVEKFPTSSFKITSVKPLEGSPEYTHEITGDMTIKGITKSITFPAKVEVTGNELKASTVFTIDRSQWDVKYGSETFFPNLGDKLIRNEIELTLNLVAKAGQV